MPLESRPSSARALADAELKTKISEVHRDNFAVYGVRKVWRDLHLSLVILSSPILPKQLFAELPD